MKRKTSKPKKKVTTHRSKKQNNNQSVNTETLKQLLKTVGKIIMIPILGIVWFFAKVWNCVSITWLRTSKRVSRFIKVNFIDLSGRLDTSRLGQFAGTIMMTIITWTAFVWFVGREWGSLENLAVLSGTSIGPMLLYRVKNYLSQSGTRFLTPEDQKSAKEYLELENFFVRNFTDGNGRINTGRIGQFQGIIVLGLVSSIAIYRIIILKEHVETSHLALLATDGGLPMAMYQFKRLLENVAEKRNSTAEE